MFAIDSLAFFLKIYKHFALKTPYISGTAHLLFKKKMLGNIEP